MNSLVFSSARARSSDARRFITSVKIKWPRRCRRLNPMPINTNNHSDTNTHSDVESRNHSLICPRSGRDCVQRDRDDLMRSPPGAAAARLSSRTPRMVECLQQLRRRRESLVHRLSQAAIDDVRQHLGPARGWSGHRACCRVARRALPGRGGLEWMAARNPLVHHTADRKHVGRGTGIRPSICSGDMYSECRRYHQGEERECGGDAAGPGSTRARPTSSTLMRRPACRITFQASDRGG